MARSGGGHSGGGHSGGGHSGGGSRSGGGHSSGGSRTSFGGSSRSGSGMGMGGSRGGMNGPGGMGDPGRRGMNPPPPGRPRRRFFGFFPFWGGGYGGGYYRGGGCGTLVTVFVVLIVLVFGLIGSIVYRSGNNTNATTGYEENISDDYESSSHNDSSHHSASTREKLDTGLIFDSNCVLDETGLIDDTAAVGDSLEVFFDATGVQPYVYLKSYDSSLTTESKMDDYAQDWYEDNIYNEGTFLLIYFEGRTESQDYFSYVCGYDIESVMDEDAIDIFWDYVDEYWYSESDTDDAILQIFDATAEEIM